MEKPEGNKLDQRNDDSNIVGAVLPSTGFDYQNSLSLSSKDANEGDTSSDETDLVVINRPIWFRLVASENQETDKPLKQISGSYQRVINNNLQVSHVKKLLVQKLGLENENEVELYLDNDPLDSSLMLEYVLQYWLDQKPYGEMINVKVGSSSADCVMVLTYGRKPQHAT